MDIKIPDTFMGKPVEGAIKRVLAMQKSKPKKTAKTSQKQIILPNEDLQFITDKSLYDEIKTYFAKTFPDKQEMFNELEWNSQNSVATGSNSYISTGVDMFFKKNMPKYRIARQIDLETDLKKFKGFYIDSGLALRSLENPNQEKAKHIQKQLKQRGLNKFPVWMDLRGLELDSNLNFNLTDESRYKQADCLNWKNETKYSQIDDFGLPKSKDKNSSRKIWTNKQGLSRCFLYWGSDLGSRYEGLAVSDGVGRVALVRVPEGT